jgi:uncharacterized protein
LGFEIGKMTSTPLQDACRAGNVEEVRRLLNYDVNHSRDDMQYALVLATAKSHINIMRLLFSHGALLTQAVFFIGAGTDDPAVFQEFIHQGWDINSTEFGSPGLRHVSSLRNRYRLTVLRLVTTSENCVQWFLEHGADPNITDDHGFTAFQTAGLQPSTAVFDLLLAHGAQPDVRALYEAIDRDGNGGVPIMTYLLDHGIDINISSSQWASPLHCAVVRGTKAGVQLLLDRGANVEKTNSTGQTAADIALKSGKMDLYEMISSQLKKAV